ncbi:MAG: reverse transcriptase family protein, partial [gamma proteobacterium symbiont of Bathyaustriella thionipta]|nr:reverse transcriptase family protein [gamma proteobacterium symbiont of Bathyaustriella thionipta]
MEDSFHLAVDTGITDIVITGDFNYNMLAEPTRNKIASVCQQFALTQHVTEPTHYTENSASLLDIIMVTNNNSLYLSGVGDPFLSQDTRFHCPVFGILNFSKPKVKSFQRQIWLYEQGDYDLMREKASTTDWESMKCPDINLYANKLTDHVKSISKECIPNRMIKVNPSDLPWITTNIKKSIRKRKRLFRKAKRSNDPVIWQKFKRFRNKTTSMVRLSKQSHIDKLSERLKSDSPSSRNWWSTLKYFISSGQKSNIPPLQSNGELVVDDTEKANLLNDFFRDQTLLDDQNIDVPRINNYNVISSLDELIINPEEVRLVLKALPIGKASGPDDINNRVLKELSDQLAIPFCSLFNQSLHDGIVPEIWKKAHVSPIPKKDDKSLVSNYRPISLLSNVDKSFERIVFKHLYNHLLENNILTAFQSGFIPGDSTTNQLTFLYDSFCRALDEGKEVRAVFCDISKAFDRVWHKGLIHKLEAAGIAGTTLRWFTDYLKDRKQRVIIPG